MKIRPVGAELCHADRHTGGHDEGSTRFGNFPKAPKECISIITMLIMLAPINTF
jgi:hypothetical protein